MKIEKNIGYAMRLVVTYVTEHPGCTKYAAGKWAWNMSHGNSIASLAYIYGPVNRAIKAGLIRAVKVENHYELTVRED